MSEVAKGEGGDSWVWIAQSWPPLRENKEHFFLTGLPLGKKRKREWSWQHGKEGAAPGVLLGSTSLTVWGELVCGH